MHNLVAILTGPSTHLDHIGVLSAYLDIPLIVVEEKTFDLAKKFYPQTNVIFKLLEELTIEYLSSFDMILQSGIFLSAELDNLFGSMGQKKPRFVYCPHGNSDKGHSLKKGDHPPQDISLVYGEQMLSHIKKNGLFEKTREVITTGNYRFTYYLKHKQFYDDLAHQHVFSKLDPNKKTILYAPTYPTHEYDSSFFSDCENLIEKNTSYNLVIKPHPFLEDHFPSQTWHLVGKYENFPNTLFLLEFPPIYPLLSKVDCYVGDFSSVGYDFLAFDKPMFFFNTAKTKDEKGRFLHRCGMEIPPGQENIYPFIENNIQKNSQELSKARTETCRYTFSTAPGPIELKNKLNNLILNPS